jgi:hypothetical protein
MPMRGNDDFFAGLDESQIIAELFFKDGHIDDIHV